MIKDSDKQYFIKLKSENIIDLALFLPIYEDYRLHNEPTLNGYNAFNATVQNVYFSSKVASFSLFIHNYGKTFKSTIFNPKPYHRGIFKNGFTSYFYAKIEYKNGNFLVIQPKKINSHGIIYTKYNTTLKQITMKRLINTYINRANLAELPSDIVDNIIDIHFPTNRVLKGDSAIETLKFIEGYNYLSKLSKKRRFNNTYIKLYPTKETYNWIDNLPFKLTKDQKESINTITDDFSKNVSAKRMIIGDVGSGKTVIMMYCATIANREKSIIMAPTTILANQLYNESIKLLNSNINVVLVNSMNSKKVDLNGYDLIIGTHNLLYMDLPKVAVIMIDEQHRFGTKQREMLKTLTKYGNTAPHFLQFSATPIPRTQGLIESSLIDISLIKETPFNKNIKTTIVNDADFKDILIHFNKEIDNNNQVIVVYPLVNKGETSIYKSIEESSEFWNKNFSNIMITHGKDNNKDSILKEFEKNGTILVTTTLIEVGLSLPRLTTILIVGAEKLGLATLHQLRGRVSRNGLKGYCYLYTKTGENSRLKLFRDNNSGFTIAEIDLKLRKSGDIVSGTSQSGNEFKYISMSDDVIWKKIKALSIANTRK